MDYYCEVCNKFIKPKSKYNHFKSNTHKNFDKCKHIKLTTENLNINNISKIFDAYIVEHKKKFDYYLLKCEFNLIFNDYEYCPYIKSKLSDNKTMPSWQKIQVNCIKCFNNEISNSNHIAELNIVTVPKKPDMSYEFHIKHNMHAVHWTLNAMVNRNKNLIIALNRNWRHSLN